MQASLDHMVSASITDVSLNSGIRVLFKNGKLQWNQDLKDEAIVVGKCYIVHSFMCLKIVFIGLIDSMHK